MKIILSKLIYFINCIVLGFLIDPINLVVIYWINFIFLVISKK